MLEFKHEYFKRGRKDLLHKIQRKSSDLAGSQKKRIATIEKELSQLRTLFADFRERQAETLRRAAAAEERAARAEQLIVQLRATNCEFQSRRYSVRNADEEAEFWVATVGSEVRIF